eukprot:3089945-Rhodomonas_salina.1
MEFEIYSPSARGSGHHYPAGKRALLTAHTLTTRGVAWAEAAQQWRCTRSRTRCAGGGGGKIWRRCTQFQAVTGGSQVEPHRAVE